MGWGFCSGSLGQLCVQGIKEESRKDMPAAKFGSGGLDADQLGIVNDPAGIARVWDTAGFWMWDELMDALR